LTVKMARVTLSSVGLEAWCSGLTCSPVKAETAGSNPVASARQHFQVSQIAQPWPEGRGFSYLFTHFLAL